MRMLHLSVFYYFVHTIMPELSLGMMTTNLVEVTEGPLGLGADNYIANLTHSTQFAGSMHAQI